RSVRVIVMSLFFFFQAEDGIRDRNVTGVQTCALPISSRPGTSQAGSGGPCRPIAVHRYRGTRFHPLPARSGFPHFTPRSPTRKRSEERRVGKEERSRRGTDT